MLSDIFVRKMKSRHQTVKPLIVFPTMIKSITEPKFTQNGTFAQQHWRLWPGWRYTGAPQTGNNVSCQLSPKSPRSRYIRGVTLTFLQSPPPTLCYYSPLFLSDEGQTWCKKITFGCVQMTRVSERDELNRDFPADQMIYKMLLSSLFNIFSL